MDQRGADRVMAAAGAERRHLALVVAVAEAERVVRELGMVELGLGDIGHVTNSLVLSPSGRGWRAAKAASRARGNCRDDLRVGSPSPDLASQRRQVYAACARLAALRPLPAGER